MFNRILFGGSGIGEPIKYFDFPQNVWNPWDGIFGQIFTNPISVLQQNNIPAGAFTYWAGWDYGAGNKVLLSSWVSRHSSDLGAIGAGSSTGVSCKLQGSNDLSTWFDIGATDTKSDVGGLILTQTSGLGSTPYRAYRLIYRLNGGSGGNFQIQEIEFTVAP